MDDLLMTQANADELRKLYSTFVGNDTNESVGEICDDDEQDNNSEDGNEDDEVNNRQSTRAARRRTANCFLFFNVDDDKKVSMVFNLLFRSFSKIY